MDSIRVKEIYASVKTIDLGEDGWDTQATVFGESDWYEPWTVELGKLFRAYRKEFGKCVSRVYRDIAMGDGTFKTVAVGWVFQKRAKYQDCAETYLQETWVEYRGN